MFEQGQPAAMDLEKGLLPEKSDPQPTVPAWPQFLRGCIQYRESLDRQLPNAPRTEDEFQGRA